MCYSLWYNATTILAAGGRQHRGCIIPQVVTQSSVPEDGRNHRPKPVELIGIINKPLLLHLVGCLYYLSVTLGVLILNSCIFIKVKMKNASLCK